MQSRLSLAMSGIRKLPVIPRIIVIGAVSTLVTFVAIGVLSPVLGVIHSLITDYTLWFAIPLIFVVGAVMAKYCKSSAVKKATTGIVSILLTFVLLWGCCVIVYFLRWLVDLRVPVFILCTASTAIAVHGADIKKLAESSEPEPKEGKEKKEAF